MKIFRYLIFTFLIIGFTLVETVKSQVSDEIINLIENSQSAHALWSVQVRDTDGNIIENLNGEQLVRPASNFKLISSAAYLDYFGSDFTFETRLLGRGSQDGNSWVGDLLIEGSGDPTISGRFYNGNAFYVFEKWVEVLSEKGIRSIEGNIVGFDGLFDDIPYPKGWEWDDLSYYYAPETGALSFNENVVDLEVIADGPVGSTPEIQWFPMGTDYVEFVNEQVITPQGTSFDEKYRRVLGTNIILLRSTLPQGYYETESLSVTDPSLFFLDTFKKYLESRGITVTGQLYTDSNFFDWNAETYTHFDSHISVELSEIIKELNRESNNFYAEMLLKKLASDKYDVQGSTELGLKELKEYMHSMQFDTSKVELRDASGMAPATLVKASDVNNYLELLREKEYFPVFFESLAEGGLNGTLEYRFNNSPLKGSFNGKTGFVSGVRTLSGYLTTENGSDLTVSLFTNNYTAKTSSVDFVHQKILEFLYHRY
jgi:D-alanyl-D-alanine carboxypeptidase/D-alanyl-D-alanine-endopeptidase (penicillin-binding protein 4)